MQAKPGKFQFSFENPYPKLISDRDFQRKIEILPVWLAILQAKPVKFQFFPVWNAFFRAG